MNIYLKRNIQIFKIMELYPNLIEAIVQNYFKQIASGSGTKDSSGQDMIT